jgi:hypothetical protein
MLGHIAYSLYKMQKIEFIKDKEIENKGMPPTDQQLRDFQEIAGSESQLDLYRTKAVNVAQLFIDTILREDLEQQKEDFLKKYSVPGFWLGVWQGVIASFIFVALGILLLSGTGGWARIGNFIISLADK